jgi:hypothetical protein
MKSCFFTLSIAVAFSLVASGCLSRQTMTARDNSRKKSEIAHTSGGTGESYESAVKITGGKDYAEAVRAEEGYISNYWGVKDKDWRLVEKTTVTDSGRTYDMVHVEIPKVGEKHFYYFDITRYQKKRKSSAAKEEGEISAPGPRTEPVPVNERNPSSQAKDSVEPAAVPVQGPDSQPAPAPAPQPADTAAPQAQ